MKKLLLFLIVFIVLGISGLNAQSTKHSVPAQTIEDLKEDLAEKERWIFWGKVGAAIFVSLIVLGALSEKTRSKTSEVLVVQATQSNEILLLENPKIDKVRELLNLAGGQGLVMFDWVTEYNGKELRVHCGASMGNAGDPVVVSIDGTRTPKPIAWNGKNAKILKFLGLEPLQHSEKSAKESS